MDRFAAIADIHGNLHALEAVLADIDRCHIRATVNLGDNLFGPLDPPGTADLLTRLNLPGMSLFHGTPRADTEYLLETVHAEDVTPATQNEIAERIGTTEPNSLFLCRHTHLPRTVAFGDSLIVNPGSVGLQAYQDDSPVPHVMETGSPHARLRHPGKKSQRLACRADSAGLRLGSGSPMRRTSWPPRLGELSTHRQSSPRQKAMMQADGSDSSPRLTSRITRPE